MNVLHVNKLHFKNSSSMEELEFHSKTKHVKDDRLGYDDSIH